MGDRAQRSSVAFNNNTPLDEPTTNGRVRPDSLRRVAGSRVTKFASDNKKTVWACFFYKHDPVLYRSCRDVTLSRSADITQHLTRKHLQPVYCPRCGETFEGRGNDGRHKEHLRQGLCQQRPFSPYVGVTPDQLAELRTCKREADVSEASTSAERRWYMKYQILFGDDVEPPPSPYRTVLEDDNARHICTRWIQSYIADGYPERIAQSIAPNDRNLPAMFHKLLHHFQGRILEPLSASIPGPSSPERLPTPAPPSYPEPQGQVAPDWFVGLSPDTVVPEPGQHTASFGNHFMVSCPSHVENQGMLAGSRSNNVLRSGMLAGKEDPPWYQTNPAGDEQ